MDKNVQKEEGISLMDVVRLLLSKIKLLILLVLIGGFIGGAFSVWQTKDVKYYGTQMRFYVNPENPTMSADGSGLNTSGSEYGLTAYTGALSLKRMAIRCPSRTKVSTGAAMPSTVMRPSHLALFMAE